jgi:hypothetical protein
LYFISKFLLTVGDAVGKDDSQRFEKEISSLGGTADVQMDEIAEDRFVLRVATGIDACFRSIGAEIFS